MLTASIMGGGDEAEPRYGWVVVASTHVVFALWVGILKTIGVLLPALTERYETDAWVLGWIAAVVCATNNIAAVFGSVLSGLIGGRQVAVLGGVMATSGLLLAAVSSNMLQFGLSLAVLTGLGFGAVMCICKVYLGMYFKERLALASGIAIMGVPVGLIIFPTFVELLKDTYGIRGTLLILGALTMHLIPCGILLRQHGMVSGPLRGNTNGYTLVKASKTGEELHPCLTLKALVGDLLDVRLLTSLGMWMLIIIYTLFSFVNDSWMTFMVSNAMSKGYGAYVATTFSIIAGCSAVIFSLLQGVIISRRAAGIRAVSAVATGVGSTALLLNILLDSYLAMGVAVAMYGVALAVLNPTLVCLVIETQGLNRTANALGWMGLSSGIFRILFGFPTGLLYDITRNYDATFILLGVMMALIIPMLYMDTLVTKYRNLVGRCKGEEARPI